MFLFTMNYFEILKYFEIKIYYFNKKNANKNDSTNDQSPWS
jgi:hypothetical protein